MTESDGGSSKDTFREMFNCGMCGGSGRIVRGNDGINIRCPDCQGEGKTYTRLSRPNKPSGSPSRSSGAPISHPPSCDCPSCTLLRSVEIPVDKLGRIKRLWRRILNR